MISVPSLLLTQGQATCLLAYIQTYRRHVLTQIAPSRDRNTIQRSLQALQGKFIQEIDQRSAIVQLALSSEERGALRTMLADFLQVRAQEPATNQRDATLRDLATLKAIVEKGAYGPGKHFTSSLVS